MGKGLPCAERPINWIKGIKAAGVAKEVESFLTAAEIFIR